MNDKPKNLFQRLHAVMKEVSYVQKEDKMVNNQYRFVSHDGVTAAVRPALLNHGVLAVPQNLKRFQDGNRTEVELDVVFINIDDPKESFAVPSVGYGIDTQDKGPGKAISYAVKYALLKALSLETGDDPERDLIEHKPDNKKDASREEKVFMRDFLYRLGNTDDIPSLVDEMGDEFGSLSDQTNDLISQQIEIRKTQIKNGVTIIPPKFAFLDVPEAVEFLSYSEKLIEKAKDNKKLGDWMVENDHKLKALDITLGAQKYQTSEGTPYQRLMKAYNKRIPHAAE
jgi:hypothetical protein